ncbi:MAG: type III pantothenate kinase [Dehalococcoidia bacterium]|nr:type III pantothenate kinase [Dehalococcoidia bacterium]
MLLAIGIGNTSIKLGLFNGDALVADWHISTDLHRQADEYIVTLDSLLRNASFKASDISGAAMWCTVPSLVPTFESVVQRFLRISPLIVATGIKTGVSIRMDNPREVGADRIVNAVAAHALYKSDVIVVDMGTATTFDTISREGNYLGGAIAPGIMMAADALFTRPAQLYRVQLTAPLKAIGTNTVAAMQSGIVLGYTSLVEGMVARIQAELSEQAMVVATGGYSSMILGETKIIDAVETNLSLIGLKILFRLNKS